MRRALETTVKENKETVMSKRMYTVKGFNEDYSVGKTKTYELINKGELRKVKFGARTFITAESAEAWRERLLQAQADAALI